MKNEEMQYSKIYNIEPQKNIYARLPPDEYKDHVEARRIARAVKAQLETLVCKDENADEDNYDMFIEDFSARIILKKRKR